MEGSENRIRTLVQAAVPMALLAGVIAVAGCGGSAGNDSAKPPVSAGQTGSAGGGVVSAEGTLGFVGPAGRVTAKSQQFDDKGGKIPPNANRKTKGVKGGGVVGPGDACADGGLLPADDNQAQLNAAILCLVNAERAVEDLSALTQNAQLDQAASGMAQQMVSEHFFAHDTPEGKTVVDRVQPTGYIPNSGDWVVGENLAWGSGALSTPQAIVNGWMNSPGHKANILAPDYKDIGLAVAMGAPSTSLTGGTVYVNDFGAKSGADLNIKLPPESGASGTSAAAATVAGTGSAAKAKNAKHKRKVRRHRRRHRQH